MSPKMDNTKNSDDEYEIYPPSLSVEAMRSSGYRDAAHAIAELVDNSIQAGLAVRKKTDVHILCEVEEGPVKERVVQRIKEIGVYDNGSGMTSNIMRLALSFGNGTHLDGKTKGMGKFGMGLPNSSISQGRRVDVYSWQKSKCFHTYLDLDEIKRNKVRFVPNPQPVELPEKWAKMISEKLESHGTLVVWSKLDKLKWRTPRALFENSELIIGRMYRYFIAEERVSIKFAAYIKNGKKMDLVGSEMFVRPNDPLYLMEGTTAPELPDKKPAFVFKHEETINVEMEGESYPIKLRYSICRQEARDSGGNSPFGKDAAKNVGISVMREGRELEMEKSFTDKSDTRERWWGCEVHFGAELDEIFGVDNTKQSARNFKMMDVLEDAKNEDMTENEYKEHLKDSNDPRAVIYTLSQRIEKAKEDIFIQVQRMGKPRGEDDTLGPSSAEARASEAVRKRRAELGKTSESDQAQEAPEKERVEELSQELATIGNVPVEETREAAAKIIQLKPDIKFIFEKQAIPGSAIFDIRSKAGVLIIVINAKHPASDHLFELLEQSKEEDKGSKIYTAMKLMLMAWARLEDEASAEARERYGDIRQDWGRIAREFIKMSEH